jgi:tetratricopeptide (TPR) repeat protein
MKHSKRESRKRNSAAAPVYANAASRPWVYVLSAVAAVFLVFWAYRPAIDGPFLFDDISFSSRGLSPAAWLHGMRPVLGFTYWINSRISQDTTYSYHIFNLIVHCFAAAAIFLIVRRLLELSGVEASRRNSLAAFAAFLFLLHPAQTESVAYLAGRSEALSDGLAFVAFALFLCRGTSPMTTSPITWMRAIAVCALFAAALLTKQQTIVLPALLLLTDYYWNPGFTLAGIRSNWRLYVPMMLGALGGVAYFWNSIVRASSAGFGLKDFTWYQYFFTQCRALFVYLGMFLLPLNLNADWDFPISRTVWEHGATLGLAALLACAGLAWHYRRRFPLASYGYFVFLLLMAPTSSILPIRDPVAERRLYFGMLGLLLMLVDGLNRLKAGRKAVSAICSLILLAAAIATHSRAQVWSGATALWEDTVRRSPNKPRVHFELGNAYYDAGQCGLAASEFQKAAQLGPATRALLVNWAIACDCLNRPDEALAKLYQAAAIQATGHVYSQIGMIYAKQAQWPQALDALAQAEKLDPGYFMIYVFKGGVHLATNQSAAAIEDYQQALALRPDFEPAQQGLSRAQSRLRLGR